MKLDFDLKPSGTLQFSEVIREMNKNGEQVISLGLGEPTFNPPPSIISGIIDAVGENKSKYENSAGNIQLREKIASDFNSRHNSKVTKQDIIITNGAKHALTLLLTYLLKPSDEVIYFSPNYVSYPIQIKLAEPDAKPVPINLDQNLRIDITKFKNAITSKTKVAILNFPHNPTGLIPENETLIQIIEVCREKDIFIISDEVYSFFNFEKCIEYSLYELLKDNAGFAIVNSFSKSCSIPGYRVGYIICDTDSNLISIITLIQQHQNTNICSAIQVGISKGFPLWESYIPEIVRDYEAKVDFARDLFNRELGTTPTMPKGGMFIFLDISKTGMNSDLFCKNLLIDKKVATIPGVIFGSDWNDYIRVSLASDLSEFKLGILKLIEFIKERSSSY